MTHRSGEWVSVSAPYVTPRAAGSGDEWAAEAAQQGRAGTQRLLEVAEVVPDVEISAALKTPPGEPVVVRRRVMELDGEPVELTDSYYPASIARGTRLAEARKIRGGAVTLLAELGYNVAPPAEDVYADKSTARQRELLNLDEGEPVLILFRRLDSEQGLPVEVSVMTMLRGRRLRYQLGNA